MESPEPQSGRDVAFHIAGVHLARLNPVPSGGVV
jgi:hypothetical protein